METLITIVGVSHNESRAQSPLMASLIAQTDPNWKAVIYNNGPRLSTWELPQDSRISYIDSDVDSSQWGCINRQKVVMNCTTLYIVNTSVQDYYLPCFIQELNQILQDTTIDLIHWQAINHLFRYNILNGEFAWGHIDWGQWLCRTDHIRKTGIVQPENFSADFHTLQAVRQYVQKVHKINKVLCVHN